MFGLQRVSLTTAELAACVRRSRSTVRRWVREGRIHPVSPQLPDVFGEEVLAALGLTTGVTADDGVVERAARAMAAVSNRFGSRASRR